MRDLEQLFVFAGPYLRRYWRRFVGGVLLGILFGALNGAFVGASTVLFTRLIPSTEANAGLSTAMKLPHWLEPVRQQLLAWADSWLPLIGRALDGRQIVGGLLLLPLLAAARGLTGYASSYLMAWTSQRIVGDLKVDAFERLSAQSLDFFNRSTTADLLTRINQDTQAILGCLRLGLSDLVKEPVTIISVFFTLWWLDWKLTLMALIFLPLVALPSRIIRKKVRRASDANLHANIAQDNLLVESLGAMRILQAFGLVGRRRAEFVERNREANRFALKAVQARETLNPVIETFGALGMGAVIIFLFATQRPVANLMGFVVGLTLFYTPLKKIMAVHVYFAQTRLPVKRLLELFHLQPTVRDVPHALPVPAFEKAVAFENVSFRYETDGPWVLENFSLELPRGARIGLAGPSGSGKSTVVNLLLRFYDPVGGAVVLDGNDLRGLRLGDVRSHMALVSQEVLLFNASVAENIALGKANATPGEIEAAARAANAHEFIQALPLRYETVIGERGARLSGGQRQRLAIARAFIRNAPILVLDETTASLDSQAEAEVQGALDRLARERTVLAIAHRLATLANMDRIIVLAQGQIAEQGTFAELLARGGLFAKMAAQQGLKQR